MRFNSYLYEKTNENLNLKVLDFSLFLDSFSAHEKIDWKFYYMSMMSINPKLSKAFKNWFSLQLDSIALKRKKCLVLDLDNTLWGGILGEDGIEGIKIGGSYPGNAFTYFQTGIKELSKKGILLTICSKNNETDVLQIWDNLPGMVLSDKDFVASRINWNNKAENIKELAEELNLGLDSFVYIDDNPTERDLVRGILPMVEVPDFPDQPYELARFYKQLVERYFTVYKLTKEDIFKTQQYKENAFRSELQKKYTNFDDYISNLGIEISISSAKDFNISRIVQMCQKTNQFNLTTKRYIEDEIRSLIAQESWVNCISVKDKFGDNGISGLIIVTFDMDHLDAEIDTLLLSCRILGKKIEHQFMSFILNKLFQNDIRKVSATFIPTQKNMQVASFYEDCGFSLIETDVDGRKKYMLKKENFKYDQEKKYKVIEV
jgi:FkbH-like protein